MGGGLAHPALEFAREVRDSNVRRNLAAAFIRLASAAIHAPAPRTSSPSRDSSGRSSARRCSRDTLIPKLCTSPMVARAIVLPIDPEDGALEPNQGR